MKWLSEYFDSFKNPQKFIRYLISNNNNSIMLKLKLPKLVHSSLKTA